MVVVDPDERKDVLVLLAQPVDGFHSLVGEELIHFHISLYTHKSVNCTRIIRFASETINLPMIGEENGPVGHRVEQRPEGAVATSVVEPIELGLFHEDGHNLIRVT